MKKSTQLLLGVGCCVGIAPAVQAQTTEAKQLEKPNVILIYADDLGMGLLSCMGQKEYMTPNIDKLFR